MSASTTATATTAAMTTATTPATTTTDTFAGAGAATASPPQVLRATRLAQGGLVVGLALVAIAATLPFWGESSWMRELVEIACYFVFASMWNLLAGYGGMVSIGQQAYFGLGGYA